MQTFDIVIAGGGMSGATAAIGLARLGLSIALIEQVEPELETSPSFDQRAVALSAASVSIYQSLDLWKQINPTACSIKHISVSDQGNFGFTRLNAKDYNLEALGEVIPLDQAGPILWDAVKNESLITSFCPAKVESVISSETHCEVLLQSTNSQVTQKNRLEAKLLLAADGTFSDIAHQLKIEVSREPYAQHAVITNIETEMCHQYRAFERFTASGPLALLPLTAISENDFFSDNGLSKRMSLVWCHTPENIDQVMEWSDLEFKNKLQEAFGFRLGKIEKVGNRSCYPLSLHLAQKTFTNRVLLLGNSAHTVHPIAGQGFNLGLRDIAALIEQIELALSSEQTSQQDFGSGEFLEKFSLSRQADWQQTITATDSFARLFSNQFLPLVLARNIAMNIVNKVPLVKRQLAKAAMGYSGLSSKLARGIPLNENNSNLNPNDSQQQHKSDFS